MGKTNWQEQVRGAILGHAVGDALGVPVEFRSREERNADPVVGMRGYGTFYLPAGTWSDDTSMNLAELDSLRKGLDYNDIMERFCAWSAEGAYTPYGELFDIGIATSRALFRYEHNGIPPLECGGSLVRDNGNGSLMRILPIILYVYRRGHRGEAALQIVHNGSRLTHRHPRSQMACGIYACVAGTLLDGGGREAVLPAIQKAKAIYEKLPAFSMELRTYERLFSPEFPALSRSAIRSSGYVVDTLEAALWCLLTTGSYRACTLAAVNLGEDTDTVAAVAGGLAGLLYGVDSIPAEWLEVLVRRELLEELCSQFAAAVNGD